MDNNKEYMVLSPDGKFISVDEFMETDDYHDRLERQISDFMTNRKEQELINLFREKRNVVVSDNNRILSVNDSLELSLGRFRRSYLVKFVDPKKEYTVDYIIGQDGTKKIGTFVLKGEDLTENQILQLFLKELL